MCILKLQGLKPESYKQSNNYWCFLRNCVSKGVTLSWLVQISYPYMSLTSFLRRGCWTPPITESDVECALPSRYFSSISHPLSTPVAMAARSQIQTAPLWVETFRKWWETTVAVCVRWGVDALPVTCKLLRWPQLLQPHTRCHVTPPERSARVRRRYRERLIPNERE